jgi:aspartate-semialdehyde dehydrogenase
VSPPLRVAVVGATGLLGSEVLAVLSQSALEVAELVAVATDRSLGQEIEFRGATHPVETELPDLCEVDLVFLCVPAAASLDLVRRALRAEVAAIDASGALCASADLPLAAPALALPPAADESPLIVTPPGAALACALALAPLAARAGLERVLAFAVEAASRGGRQGIESLYQESIAIFNQEDLPAPEVFGRPVAFDCIPALGVGDPGGSTEREALLAGSLARLLGGDVRVAATLIQVPAFVGFGASLAVETRRSLDAKEAEEALAAAPGIELWRGEASGQTLRAAAGRDRVLVGRVRRDPTRESGLLLWIASDVLRLAAANAVEVAVARLRGRH